MNPAPERAPAPTPLGELLAARIRSEGPLTFADFMAECLYHPEHGYYSRAEAQRFADYYTSVDVHPIFGRLLARQLAEMWQRMGCPADFLAVECGAGSGRLARHILDFSVRALPEFCAAARYVAVERSAARRAAHSETLREHVRAGKVVSAESLPRQVPAGCIFSNELLDALPVHRVLCEHGELREMYVALDGERLTEQPGPLSTPEIAGYFSDQGVTLGEGQQAEAGLAASRWMEQAGQALGRGFVVSIDYGHEARELYSEHHARGTVLAYRQHRATEEQYASPGQQDLTAHVNFTALDVAGRRAGLTRTGLVTQSQFLLALGSANEFADLYDEGHTELDRIRARQGLKELIHPEGMGETFRVLVQHKGVESPRLTGLGVPG